MKVLASDFDGTLYFENVEGHYKKEDIIAIKKFQSAGHKFGVCTGRPYMGISHFMSKDIHIDFYITNSGACVYDGDGNILIKNDMPIVGVKELLKLYPNQRAVIMCNNKVYVKNDFNHVFGDASFRATLENDDALNKEIIFGTSFHFDTEEDAKKATQYVDENIEGITAYQNINDVDCVKTGCSKETGINELRKLWDVKEEDVACVGDSYNDLPMLKAFKNSFTFTYSPSDVQSQAGHVVDQMCYAIEELLK